MDKNVEAIAQDAKEGSEATNKGGKRTRIIGGVAILVTLASLVFGYSSFYNAHKDKLNAVKTATKTELSKEILGSDEYFPSPYQHMKKSELLDEVCYDSKDLLATAYGKNMDDAGLFFSMTAGAWFYKKGNTINTNKLSRAVEISIVMDKIRDGPCRGI